VIVGGNPVYNTPSDLKLSFERLDKKVKLRVHLSEYKDETTRVCHWHVPQAHYLESWADARSYDGTVTILQPLIQPLYNGRSAAQILQMMTEQPDAASLAIVKGYWETQRKGADFENWWRRSVHDGLIAGSALALKTPALKAAGAAEAPPQGAAGGLEVAFRPDPGVYDGRFANLGWLQEMPKPVTKLTWDNAAVIGPATAHRLNVETGDMLRLTYRGHSLNAPVWVQPGVAAESVTLHLGSMVAGSSANKSVLQGLPNDKVRPVILTATSVGSVLEDTLPPYSFTVWRIHK